MSNGLLQSSHCFKDLMIGKKPWEEKDGGERRRKILLYFLNLIKPHHAGLLENPAKWLVSRFQCFSVERRCGHGVTHAGRWEMLSLSRVLFWFVGMHWSLDDTWTWGIMAAAAGFDILLTPLRFFGGGSGYYLPVMKLYSLCCSQTQSWTFYSHSSHLLMYCCLSWAISSETAVATVQKTNLVFI